MSLIIIGEAATKVVDGYAAFTQAHPEIPWRSMRGMRNRIAHGYFDIKGSCQDTPVRDHKPCRYVLNNPGQR